MTMVCPFKECTSVFIQQLFIQDNYSASWSHLGYSLTFYALCNTLVYQVSVPSSARTLNVDKGIIGIPSLGPNNEHT